MRIVSPMPLHEQMRQRHDAADRAGLLGPGVGDAEMQRIIESLADLLVRVDHEQRIDRLGADHDVVEILLVEDVEVFLELGDHDGEEVAMLVVAENAAEFLQAFLLVLALDDRAFVDADADGDLLRLAGLDDIADLGAVGDVAGVEANLVNARVDRFQRPLKMEMHIRDDRHGHLREDFLQRGGVLLLRNRDADDIRPGGGELLDLGDAFVDFVRIAGGHGLDGNRRIPADAHETVCIVPQSDLSRLAADDHLRYTSG